MIHFVALRSVKIQVDGRKESQGICTFKACQSCARQVKILDRNFGSAGLLTIGFKKHIRKENQMYPDEFSIICVSALKQTAHQVAGDVR